MQRHHDQYRSSPDLDEMGSTTGISATTQPTPTTKGRPQNARDLSGSQSSDSMAAMGSVSLLSVQARPARQVGIDNTSRNARLRSAPVMAVSKASRQDQVQNVAQKALAVLAATQLLAAGPALADGPLESFTNAFKADKTGAAIGGSVSGEGKEKTGVSDASSQVAESIKISQSPKSNEADSLADKFSKDTPSSGAPSTAGVGKSMGTTEGRG